MASSNRYGAGRKTEFRTVLPVITVVCDDTKTAANYFTLVKQQVKDRCTVLLCRAPYHGADANAVITLAGSRRIEADAGDKVFVLVDLDSKPNEDACRSKCESIGVELIFSNPCYEVWTLAHLEDTGELFVNCDAVLTRIKIKWKEQFHREFGPKAQADYRKILARREQAIERCRRRTQNNSQSWTEVWRVVQAITKIHNSN